jgi:uncharacterized oligopeptide transporter (OPT) family protein
MCGGGVLAYLVLIPLIKFFGDNLTTPLAPGTMPISEMGPDDVRRFYVLYIGVGAVAAGGIISLVRSAPTIWHGIQAGLRDVGLAKKGADQAPAETPRTERDLSMKFVGIGIVVLLAGIVAAPHLHMNLLGALLLVVFGFLFVTVSSRLTGEIGSSSNPISGMTVATLLLTCLVFLLIGWTGGTYYVTALSVGAIVCIAASNGGTTSQDLKTGFLLGATPKYQQIAILCGAFASALIMGPLIRILNDAGTVYVPVSEVAPAGLQADVSQLEGKREGLKGVQAESDSKQYLVWEKIDPAGGSAQKYLVDDSGRAVWLVDPGINGTHTKRPDGSEVHNKFNAPKAILMSYIIKGILGHKLPWALVLFGVMIAITLEMCGLPALAFAVGVYLPLSSSSPIWIGGMIRWLVDWHTRRKLRGKSLTEEQLIAEGDKSQGVLLASGYIAGGAITGILIAILTGVPSLASVDHALDLFATAHNPAYAGAYADGLSLIPFAVLGLFLYLVGRDVVLHTRPPEPEFPDRVSTSSEPS